MQERCSVFTTDPSSTHDAASRTPSPCSMAAQVASEQVPVQASNLPVVHDTVISAAPEQVELQMGSGGSSPRASSVVDRTPSMACSHSSLRSDQGLAEAVDSILQHVFQSKSSSPDCSTRSSVDAGGTSQSKLIADSHDAGSGESVQQKVEEVRAEILYQHPSTSGVYRS